MPTDTNTALVDAISLLQKAQATLEEAIKSINDHNIATDSHMDIRNILDTILNGDEIYTRDQIIDLISEKLDAHIAADIDKAHPSITTAIEEINENILSIAQRVDQLESWRDGEESGENTELQRLIKEVTDRYAPILEALQISFREAQEAGQAEVADAIKQNIQETMDQQTADIMKVIDDWQAANSPSGV